MTAETTTSAKEAADLMDEIVTLQEAKSVTEKRIATLKAQLRAFMDDNGMDEFGGGELGIIAKVDERSTPNGHKYDLDSVSPETITRAWQAHAVRIDHEVFKAIKKGNDSGWIDELKGVYSAPGKTEYFIVKRGS